MKIKKICILCEAYFFKIFYAQVLKLCRKLKKYLIKVNSQMQDSIMNTEDDIHRNVTSLLEKYEKCTSASSVMAGKHKEAKKKMEEDFLLSKDVVECEKTGKN